MGRTITTRQGALTTTILTALALLLGACGSEEPEGTPVACKAGTEAYLTALQQAPDQALLDDNTPISDCLVPDQPAGDLSTVGATMIEVATKLNTKAQKDYDSRATVELGYLVGSVEEAASGTAGIHTDLVRRINSAARFSDDGKQLPAEFERNFGIGYAAAREAG